MTPASRSGGDWLVGLMPHFLEQTRSRLAEIEVQTLAVRDGSDPIAALKAICDVAHKISGTADTFGFSDLGSAAQALESVCASGSGIVDEPMVIWSGIERPLGLLLQEIANVLEPM